MPWTTRWKRTWTAFLSADHGGANVPSHASAEGLPVDYWQPGNLMDAVELAQDRWGFTPQGESWILRHSNDQIFLNHPLIDKRGLDRNAMARFVAQRCADNGLSQRATCDTRASTWTFRRRVARPTARMD